MKITLKMKKENTVESIQHDVEKLSLLQFSQSIKAINEIIKIISKEPALEALMQELLADDEQSNLEMDQRFLGILASSFETLLLHIPEEVTKLLAIMSGVKLEVLQVQALEDVFDIYDAILEVNDIEKLVVRAKKSLAVTKKTAAFMNKVQQATASPMA